MVRRKFIALKLIIEKSSHINYLNLYLKKLEKRELKKSKVYRKKEIKIKAENSEIKCKKTTEKINKMKKCFFKTLAR